MQRREHLFSWLILHGGHPDVGPFGPEIQCRRGARNPLLPTVASGVALASGFADCLSAATMVPAKIVDDAYPSLGS